MYRRPYSDSLSFRFCMSMLPVFSTVKLRLMEPAESSGEATSAEKDMPMSEGSIYFLTT